MKLLGAILAGGRSRRFGSDKALADIDGMPMIVRVAGTLRPYVDDLVACGHPAPPAGMATVPDVPRPGLGPLGGLAGALHHAAAQGYDAVITLGCDTPGIDPALIAALAATTTASYVDHTPIVGWWPVGMAAMVRRHLDGDGPRSVRAWARSAGADAIDTAVVIPNLNTRDDVARWCANKPM